MNRIRLWGSGAAIVLLTLLVYSPMWHADFVWDDDLHLTGDRNKVIRDPSPVRIWTDRFVSFEYYPVTWTSYWLEYRVWGMHPRGYHVVNVLLHAACALLAWRTLLHLKVPSAWLVALVFALHPVNVETAAWIAQRKNLLSMLFFLAAVLAHLRHEDHGGAPGYFVAVVCFAAAMLSKAAVVGLPVILLVCAWWRRGVVTRRDIWRVLPYAAVAVILTIIQQPVRDANVIGPEVVRHDGFFARLAGAGWAPWFYLYKTLLPVDLQFVYPRWQINPTSVISYLPGMALSVIFVVLLWLRRMAWGRVILFAMVCYLTMLGPALGLVDFYFLKYSFVADHYQYFGILAVIALVIGTIRHILRQVSKRGALVGTIAAMLVAVTLATLSWRQQSMYRDAETLWRNVIKTNSGTWLAHYKLAKLLAFEDRLIDAEKHHRLAFELEPSAEVKVGLATVLASQGRHGEAIDEYRAALAISPDFAPAHVGLGTTLLKERHFRQAVDHLRRGLARRPDHATARYNLARALTSLNRLDEATNHYLLVLEIAPDHVSARINLGTILAARGRRDEAIALYREALAINPDSVQAHNNLGNVLGALRRFDEAIEHYRAVLRIAPSLKSVRSNLEKALRNRSPRTAASP